MNEEDNGRKFHTPVTEVDGETFYLGKPVRWTAIVERFRSSDDHFSAKIRLGEDRRMPEIGDLVLVQGRKGAEFIAPILALRNATYSIVHVITANPPWSSDSYLAKQERSWAEAIHSRLEARKKARLMDVREQENLCVVCGEPDLAACACVRAERERLAQEKREAAEQVERAAKQAAERYARREHAEKCRAHNERADAARANLKEEAVRAAIEEKQGGLAAAGRALGIDKYSNGRQDWYSPKPTSAGAYLSEWMKKNAPDLPEYARELRKKFGK